MSFKERYCKVHRIDEEDFVPLVLKKILFKRTRILAPVASLFFPNFLFHERRLVETAGESETLSMVQFQIDFYHHKFVSQSACKDILKVRASGIKLMRIANEVFRLT